MILSFYTVIVGWTLCYILFSAGSILSSFDVISTGIPYFTEFTSTYGSVAGFCAVLSIAALPAMKGVRGIERFVRVILPLMLLLTVLILGRMLMLPNAIQGVRFFLTPDLSSLTNLHVWLVAVAQAMFSLSVGGGIILTYAAYSKESNPIGDTAAVSLSDLCVAFLSGLIIFSSVYSFGLEPGEGPSLAFTTFPYMFSAMGYGTIVALLFYAVLFFAGITSIVSILEFVCNNISTIFGLKRTKTLLMIVSFVFIAGLPVALSYTPVKLRFGGLTFLELYDHLFVNLTAPIAILTITGLGLLWKSEDFISYMKRYTTPTLARFFVLWIKIIIPIVGIILLGKAIESFIGMW